jgi:hypothetical protein
VAGQVVDEEGVGPVTVIDTSEPQFRHEPILECAPQPLDATLGLGLRAAMEPIVSSAKARPSCVGTRMSTSCSSSVSGLESGGSKMVWRSWYTAPGTPWRVSVWPRASR